MTEKTTTKSSKSMSEEDILELLLKDAPKTDEVELELAKLSQFLQVKCHEV